MMTIRALNLTILPRAFDWLTRNAEELTLGGLIAAVLVLIMLGMRWLGHRMLARDPRCLTWRGVVGRVLAKTKLLFMVATALATVARYADMPAKPEHLFTAFFTIVAGFQAALWLRELILGVIHRNVGDDPGGTALGNAYGVIRVLVSVVLFGLALVLILDNLGVNVTALVAGLGVGGIAIGLAAQGIFSDLFAALAILFDRPFRRGDTIQYDQTTGTVERIGLKTTRMRAVSGEQIIMANTKLLEREIHNLAAANGRRQTLTFGLTYQTSPEWLARAAMLAGEIVNATGGCTLARCVPTKLGINSIEYDLVWDDESLSADTNAQRRASILLALIGTFAREKIGFAFPTQTSFTAAPDGTLIMPYPDGGSDSRLP